MKLVLAVVIVLAGIIGGGVAGIMLRKDPVPANLEVAEDPADMADDHAVATPDPDRAFVEMRPQTIIPVVAGGRTKALMLFELAVDVPAALVEEVHAVQPRLRDAFLTNFLQAAQTGAFDENFTDDHVIAELRATLTRTARRIIGDDVASVLILDIMRQEQ